MCAIFNLVAACAGVATNAVAARAAIPIAESTFFKVFPSDWDYKTLIGSASRPRKVATTPRTAGIT
jgi:hypothetical protein